MAAAATGSSAHPQLPIVPADWELVAAAGPGPFITRASFRRPDGAEIEWTSRRHRKGQGVRLLGAPSTAPQSAVRRPAVPRRTWWIAVLFAVGSLCFVLGALPAYSTRVSARVDGVTFFVGSIFFTSASLLCFLEAANSPAAIVDGPARRFRLGVWRPRSIDWWATAIQLIGTLFFNVMTLRAMNAAWTTSEEDRLVWRPDVIGSICFLVASYLAWAEVCHSAGRLRLRDLSWWIVVLNLVGSVWFGVSAIGAFELPDTGDVTNLRWDNGGTVLGALCFLVAAVLLIPEARARTTPARPGDA